MSRHCSQKTQACGWCFPVLSRGSLEAARVGVVVAQQGGDYWAFHNRHVHGTWPVHLKQGFCEVAAIGLTEESVRSGLSAPEVDEAITASATGTSSGYQWNAVLYSRRRDHPDVIRVEVLREDSRERSVGRQHAVRCNSEGETMTGHSHGGTSTGRSLVLALALTSVSGANEKINDP